MLWVGLTGGIGAGKSAVSSRLAERGAAVVDADLLAREVVAPGTPGLAAVAEAFGPEVLREDGSLDREALGRVVFGDPAARARLNAIVHPLIGRRTGEVAAQAEQAGAPVLVHDVPLLVENALAPAYHLVVVVRAPEAERLWRLIELRGMPEQDARARLAAQATDAQREAVADAVLHNEGDLAALHQQVDALWDDRLVPYAEHLAVGRAAPRGPVQLVDPDPGWAAAGERLVQRLRFLAGDRAVDVQHVGSTAVPGLAAKDVLDLQVEVAQWDDALALEQPLAAGGFPRRSDVHAADEVRPELDPDPQAWRKTFAQGCDPVRPANVHVRLAGSPGARAARALRDLLRADGAAREEYEAEKRRLAALHPGDVEAYGEGKSEVVARLLARAPFLSEGGPTVVG